MPQQAQKPSATDEWVETPEQALLLAKARFVLATEACKPISVVRARPLTSLACAFLLGVGLAGKKSKKFISNMLPTLAQTGLLLLRYGLTRGK